MTTISEEGCLNPTQLSELSQKLKPIIWVLQATDLIMEERVEFHCTGFLVHENGLLMTSASGLDGISKLKIKARRMDMNGFCYEAKIVFHRRNWNLMLVQVDVGDICEVGKLACDGTIVDGETILCIAHPESFVGTFNIGRAAYQCVNDVTLPLPSDSRICSEYVPTALTTTPLYRQSGHAWNKDSFGLFGGEEFQKFKQLNPLLPIIQCNLFNFRTGCSGGPVFNTGGEIVGMLISEFDASDIALHVTVLKAFLQEALVSKGVSHKRKKKRKRKKKA